MLERYLTTESVLWRYRVGPLGGYIDALADRFHERGYTRHTARCLLRGVSHLSHYLLWQGVSRVEDLCRGHIDAFFREHLPHCACEGPNSGVFSATPAAVQHLLAYLGEQGLLRGFGPAPVPPDSVAGMLMRYDAHLEKIRGLSKSSRGLHRSVMQRFLIARQNQLGELRLAALTAQEVLDYVREALGTPYSPARKRTVLHCLRVFLRFLCWERIQSEDLSRAVPSVFHWKLADVPKHLPFEQVRVLLNAPDTRTPCGKRDRAVLMLLALLGLRAGEIVALRLEHVDWRAGCLTVPKAKVSRQRVLPLPPEAAAVLSDYLRHGRPRIASRALFLRARAPQGPLMSGAVGTMVRKYILQTGIKQAPKQGAHVLRHSLATCLVNQGVPMKQIADLLGHGNIQSTYIYAKVDVTRLGEVARPFPAIEEV